MDEKTKIDPNPWERQSKESNPAWEARKKYIHMGPRRSLDRVGRECGKSRGLIERWSSTWNWVASARAFDTYADVMARKQVIETTVACQKAELEKWDRRANEYADAIYTAFLISNNALVNAEKTALATNKPVPYRQRESMVRTFVRTAPLAALALELARQRKDSGSSPAALGLDASDDRTEGRRLAVLRAFVDYKEPEAESA